MYVIQANASGTRSINISDEHLMTIQKYSLFQGLIDSNGIVDDSVLDKLRFNVRSLLEASSATDASLLAFCFDVLYHKDMKALGLHNLIILFVDWASKQVAENETVSEG